MSLLSTILQNTLLVLVIVMIFNVIIFVHELGHFLAARWRGLRIDRFQIWFGKPVWKKTINGVQYGMGWIPAGGFVALPQMAPMESIEGGNSQEEPLPPISPLDKIIVAFAGPLFSILLALLSGLVVWTVGKPKDFIPTQEVGFVEPGSSAAKAGMLPGDTIVAVNGEPVDGFMGPLDSIMARIILSRGTRIEFTVKRPGVTEPLKLTSEFVIEKSKWFQRRGLRDVGFSEAKPSIIAGVYPDSPAAEAGLKTGEEVLKVDGIPLRSPPQFAFYLIEKKWPQVRMEVRATDGAVREVSLTPERPLTPKDLNPMAGIQWNQQIGVDETIVKPDPWTQVKESAMMMWVTVTSVISPDSSIGIDHLSGPVGIAKHQFALLKTDFPWQRLLAFMVLFNVNLAILNMLPFPVLDGGHITLATLEWLARRPVKARILEIVQTAFALMLMGLMLYVTSKDIGDGFGRKGEEVVFPK